MFAIAMAYSIPWLGIQIRAKALTWQSDFATLCLSLSLPPTQRHRAKPSGPFSFPLPL